MEIVLLWNSRKDTREGQKTCPKDDNNSSRLGVRTSKWQQATVKEKNQPEKQISIESMSNKILPVSSVNPSETIPFQGMLKYFIFSQKNAEGKHFDRCISI